jgi:membrane protease YdiL (CAAX protease family)
MVAALLLVGLVAEATAWWWVVARGASVWTCLAPVLVALGGLALATGRVRAAEGALAPALGLGLAVGVALYAATRVFVAVVAPRWARFRHDAAVAYGRGGALTPWLAAALSVALVAPGEELFWRGLFLPELQRAVGGTAAVVLAWAAGLLANAPSRNLAIVAGAVVGGAVWVWLAVRTGGVLAPVASHALWTGLMLLAPPPGGSEVVTR